MSFESRLLREPLIHFLLAGVVLFSAFALLRNDSAEPADDRTIVVDRRALLTFMQYRANAFEAETFSAALDAMTSDELQTLIDAYVAEETLHREAKSLGLEESDYIIRRRMVDKMSFLLSDIADSGRLIDEAELHDYFDHHREAYAIEPAVTFTHVFFDASRRGPDAARAAAEETKLSLNNAGAAFNDAPGHGDTFPFLRNYVERTYDFVASHFGAAFAAALATLPSSESDWRGPLHSSYGEHVVLVTHKTERRYPMLDEVREAVERDYISERSRAALEQMTTNLRDRYKVVVGDIRSTDTEAH